MHTGQNPFLSGRFERVEGEGRGWREEIEGGGDREGDRERREGVKKKKASNQTKNNSRCNWIFQI